jgi:class 3 adenylate cyclase/DNA-binding SARP family transcriptional activator
MQNDAERSTLKAILFADLHQYSRLVAHDEIGTLAFVQDCFQLFREECSRFDGEFIKTTGDGVLIIFDSAKSAVEYAMQLQRILKNMPRGVSEPAQFRIGLHMGEVFRRESDVFGHAINLAARLEGQARPGAVCASQEVYQAVHYGSPYKFRSGGRVALKNIPEPVAIFHILEPSLQIAERSGVRLTISTIDGLALLTEEGDSLPLKSDKTRALLGFLALSMRNQESQDRLATLLWTDRALPEARHALAKSIARVEKALGSGRVATLIRHGDFLSLNDSWASIDVPSILQELNAGKISDVLLERSDWAESILLGLEGVSPLFNSWLKVTRRSWQERISRVLEDLLKQQDISAPLVRQAATALLLVEPCHEHAAQVLIKHYLAAGNRSAAARAYDLLAAEMKSRFSLLPSQDTAALLRTRVDPVIQPRGMPGMEKSGVKRPIIAVGAFDARSDDIDDLVFGFRADLIANLSRFREWVVLESRLGGESSGVTYVLSGSGMTAAGQAEVAVLLAGSGQDEVIWSEVFRLATDSWSSTQRNVISRIASALEIYISHDRLTRHLPGQPEQKVYDAWLRGEHLLTHWEAKDDDTAAAIFEDVIEADPSFAPAYASLASVYSSIHLVRPGLRPTSETIQRSLHTSLRSIELDPLNARAHLMVAWSTALAARYEQAEMHYELAAELNPNSPTTLISTALGSAFMGRHDAARLLMDRAIAFSPILLEYQWSHVAATRFLLSDLEGAMAAAKRSHNAILDTPGWTAATLIELGRREEASAEFKDLVKAAAANWHGPDEPEPGAVLEWFLAAFPLKRSEDRRRLELLRKLL